MPSRKSLCSSFVQRPCKLEYEPFVPDDAVSLIGAAAAKAVGIEILSVMETSCSLLGGEAIVVAASEHLCKTPVVP